MRNMEYKELGPETLEALASYINKSKTTAEVIGIIEKDFSDGPAVGGMVFPIPCHVTIGQYFQLKLLLSEPDANKARNLKKAMMSFDNSLRANLYDKEDILEKAHWLQALLNTIEAKLSDDSTLKNRSQKIKNVFVDLNQFLENPVPYNPNEVNEKYGPSFFGHMRKLLGNIDDRLYDLSNMKEKTPTEKEAGNKELDVFQKIVAELRQILSELKEAFSTKPAKKLEQTNAKQQEEESPNTRFTS